MLTDNATANHAAQAAGKQYHKVADRYYNSLEKSLGLSAKKKDTAVEELEQQVEEDKATWLHESLAYVQKLNALLEMRKFDLGEKVCKKLSSPPFPFSPAWFFSPCVRIFDAVILKSKQMHNKGFLCDSVCRC